MPCVKTFCGNELAVGARVAAVYTILLSFPMVGVGYMHFKFIKEQDNLKGREDQYSHMFGNYEKDERYERERKFLLQTGGSYIAFAVLFFMMSIFLCFGASSKNPRYIWPWLVVVGLGIGYLLVRLVYHGFIDPILPMWEPSVGLVLLLIALYFYIMVYSFKQQCVDELVAAFQLAMNQSSVIIQTQYTPVPTTTYAKDLPPPYPAFSQSNPPPPPYNPQQAYSQPLYSQPAYPQSSPFNTQQYGGYTPYPSTATTEFNPSAPPPSST
uniref:Uncharacterized protein n=1 Tax=Strigamia maritima TaxID=126957 RepID=T1J1A1_STRMM